jgi:predicted transposase/invertase (TIGR01784 family)
MAKYLNPKNDIPFKKIFGEHPHLLISFLNALLPLDEEQQIAEITYLQPEQLPKTVFGKHSIVDVKCTDNDGRSFIVEMQMCWNKNFNKRVVFNASQMLVKQLDKKKKKDFAMSYYQLQPVYSLAIVAHRFTPKDGERWYYRYQIADTENPKRILEGMEIVMVDLERFKPDRAGLKGWTMDRKRMAVLWLRFLKDIDEDATPDPELLANEEVEEALEICEVGGYTSEEMNAYNEYWANLRWEQILPDMENRMEGMKTQAREMKKQAKKDKALLAEKDNALAEKDNALAEKDNALAAQTAELEALKQQLAAMKKL